MKKYFLLSLLIAIVPNLVLGAPSRYTQLVREKQRKMEQLEKCMGSTKGLKIAGISTIGLTAVGVAGNIAEANTISENKKTLDKQDKKIESIKEDIERKQREKFERELAAAQGDGNVAVQSTVVADEHLEESNHFAKKCVELGGQYTKETFTDSGEVLSVSVPVFDGCIFTSSDNIDADCDTLRPYSDLEHKQFIDRSKHLCAYVGDAEWKCLNGQATCSDAKKSLTDKEKRDCKLRIAEEFAYNRVPDRYETKYNEFLSDFQNRVADKDGFINISYNSYVCNCREGQRWSECTNAGIVLPAFAKQYAQQYALNEECGQSNNLSTDHIKIIAKTTEPPREVEQESESDIKPVVEVEPSEMQTLLEATPEPEEEVTVLPNRDATTFFK